MGKRKRKNRQYKYRNEKIDRAIKFYLKEKEKEEQKNGELETRY